MITNQEVFDIVVTKLRKQGCKSRDIYHCHITCMYRDNNGNRCAAGWLIPDNLYSRNFERIAIGTLYAQLNEKIFGDTVEDIFLIRDLQYIHDNCDVEFWEQRWKKVAQEYNLVIPPFNFPELPKTNANIPSEQCFSLAK